VRRRVIPRRNLIRTFSYDDAFFDDNSAERPTAPGGDILERELNGAGHENSACVTWFCHRVIVKRASPSTPRKSVPKPVGTDPFAANV
jgi:hypothetical protein